ncbi:hypothetical protein I4U23_010354 [Adineta vaga]|nr:hypothetical protein I4U23_010354 [Adineta vaga]
MASKDLIKSHVNTFLQQEFDHQWLMETRGGIGKDDFKNTVAYSSFPASLTEVDFESYIDMTFPDIDENSSIINSNVGLKE